MEKKNKYKYPRRLWKVRLNDPTSGGQRVSFVTNPAMEDAAICLSKDETQENLEGVLHQFNVDSSDDSKQTVTGALLIPDKWILRKDKRTGQLYEAMITAQQIDHYIKNFPIIPERLMDTNLEHRIDIKSEDKSTLPRMIESWQVLDTTIDKSAKLGKSYPVGTYVGTYYVPNRELYDIIKQKGMGFSVESIFEEVPFEEEINNEDMKMKFQILSKSNNKSIQLFDLLLDNGSILTIQDDTYIVSINNEVAPDGEYTLNDGTVVTVQDGRAIDITLKTQNMENQNLNAEQSATETQEVKPVEQVVEAAAQEQVSTPSEIETLKAQLEEQSTKLSAIEKEKEELIQKLEAEKEELNKEIEKLKLTPPPATNLAPTSSVVDLSKMSFAERMAYHATEYEKKMRS